MKDLPILFSILDYAKILAKKSDVFNPKWEEEYFMQLAIQKSGGLKNWRSTDFVLGLDALLKSVYNSIIKNVNFSFLKLLNQIIIQSKNIHQGYRLSKKLNQKKQ